MELVLSSVLQAPQLLSGECLSKALWSFGVTERLTPEDYDVMAECLARTQLPEFGPEVIHPFLFFLWREEWSRPAVAVWWCLLW